MANGGTSDFPTSVKVYIVRKGRGLDVVDADGAGARSVKSILIRYDGEIEWECQLGPWEVLRKMDGERPFANGKDGVKSPGKGSAKIKMRGGAPNIVVCGYTIAVWDEQEKELLMTDPDIVVGPPMRS